VYILVIISLTVLVRKRPKQFFAITHHSCFIFVLSKYAESQRAEHPAEVAVPPSSLTCLQLGASLDLLTRVTGYPEPRVTFYRGDTRLANNENYVIGNFCFFFAFLNGHPLIIYFITNFFTQ
jgi:hypothetical protein